MNDMLQNVFLEQTQHVHLTPEMIQGVSVMGMTTYELNAYIETIASENPFILVPDSPMPMDAAQEGRKIHEVHEADLPRSYDDMPGYEPDDAPDLINTVADTSNSMESQLMDQLSLELRDPVDLLIAKALIAFLDDRGYLQLDLDRLADTLGIAISQVERVLKKMQTCCTPAGIGARTLQECLAAQLEANGHADPLTYQIIEHHMSDVGKGRISFIAESLKADPADVIRSIDVIKTLDPTPGAQFGTIALYAIPEFKIEKIEDEWAATPYDMVIPNLKLDVNLMNSLDSLQASNHGDPGHRPDGNAALRPDQVRAIRKSVRQAKGLIRAVEMRKASSLAVVSAIVELQADYFEYGIERLRPMGLAEIADECELSESTVSRVINSVFVDTPRGALSLRSLFTSGVSSATSLEGVSSSSVKAIIKQLIADEDPASPLSDGALVDALEAKGIEVSRRTVNKYRTTLGIPSRSQRRKRT